jgi:signal transduction histidine kinase
LPGLPLYRLLDDGAGALWISSANGILRIPTAQIDELLAGHRQRLDAAVFDQSDGMRTPECHHTSQPAGWPDPRGGVWFPTTRGFVRTAPDRHPTSAPPEARIEGATWDQHTLPPGAPLLLDPGLRPFEIRYTALRFASAEKIRFRYRMEGVDSQWIQAGFQRSARYAGLPPGDYRFLVSASLPGGPWSAPASLAVTQRPLFRQTNAFLALLALASIALATLLLRWRIHIVKGRYAAVLAERHRIAREWHDTLLAGFAAISWQLQEALSRLAVHQNEMPDQAQSTVELALKMVQHYRTEARSVIWDLRESRPASETLAAAVSSALSQLTADSPIQASATTAGDPRRLPEELERNVFRICQEAASNAKRHAQPSRISILLDYRPDRLIVRIQDDGLGFTPDHANGLATGHFGLAVMQERAERFGGRLSISSKPGEGTIIEASIPYSTPRIK